MGSLQAISSIGVIVMPLLGTAILGAVSHLPAHDWRVGSSFFVSAAMQALAVIAARRYFRAMSTGVIAASLLVRRCAQAGIR